MKARRARLFDTSSKKKKVELVFTRDESNTQLSPRRREKEKTRESDPQTLRVTCKIRKRVCSAFNGITIRHYPLSWASHFAGVRHAKRNSCHQVHLMAK